MPNKWKALACASVVMAAVQMYAQAVPGAVHPILPAMLAPALASEQGSISESDISVPEGIVARGDEPDFVVLSIEPAGSSNGRYWVKFGCRSASECLSFYASVVSSKPLTCGMRQQAAGHILPANPPVMHPGDHARLVIHSGHSVIELSVVALESGSMGQSIRVATPDYKQVFHGQVVSATQVEGAM